MGLLNTILKRFSHAAFFAVISQRQVSLFRICPLASMENATAPKTSVARFEISGYAIVLFGRNGLGVLPIRNRDGAVEISRLKQSLLFDSLPLVGP